MTTPPNLSDAKIIFGLLLERVFALMLSTVDEHDRIYSLDSYNPTTDPLRCQASEQNEYARMATQALLRGITPTDRARIQQHTEAIWAEVLKKNQEPSDTLTELNPGGDPDVFM